MQLHDFFGDGEPREGEHLFLGNISVSGLDPNYIHMWMDPAWGLLMMLDPLPLEGDWFFTVGITPDTHGMLPPPSLETLQRIFDERIGLPGVCFSNPTWLSIYQPNIRMVDRYRDGRVLLAGDAAHVHSPAGGQGMQTSIQDAYNLGWKLAYVLDGAPEALLDTYQAERLPIALHVLETTSARHQAFARPASTAQAITSAFSSKDTFADTTQLSITYRGSRLARDFDETTGIRAGDRAPDAPCISATSGKPVRLFELFRGTHFTLLSFGSMSIPSLPDIYQSHLRVYTVRNPDNMTAIPNHTLIDSDGHTHSAYGVTDDALILVRPDGYIGLTGGNIDPELVGDYLRNVIGL